MLHGIAWVEMQPVLAVALGLGLSICVHIYFWAHVRSGFQKTGILGIYSGACFGVHTPLLSGFLISTSHLGYVTQIVYGTICGCGIVLAVVAPGMLLLPLQGTQRWLPPMLTVGQLTAQIMFCSSLYLIAPPPNLNCQADQLQVMSVKMLNTLVSLLPITSNDPIKATDILWEAVATELKAAIRSASYIAIVLLTPESRIQTRSSLGELSEKQSSMIAKRVNITALLGPNANQLSQLCTPLVNQTLLYDVVNQRKAITAFPASSKKCYTDASFLNRVTGVSTIICTPIIHSNVLLGALQFGFRGRPHAELGTKTKIDVASSILGRTMSYLEPLLPADNPLFCNSPEAAKRWTTLWDNRVRLRESFHFQDRATEAPVNDLSHGGHSNSAFSNSGEYLIPSTNSSSTENLVRRLFRRKSRSNLQGRHPSSRSLDEAQSSRHARKEKARSYSPGGTSQKHTATESAEPQKHGGTQGMYLLESFQMRMAAAASNPYVAEATDVHQDELNRAMEPQFLAAPSHDDDQTEDTMVLKYEIIGKGGFATVYRGSWSKMEVAVKVIELSQDDDSNFLNEELSGLLEGAVSWTVSHHHIVRTYTYITRPSRTQHGNRTIEIVMEYCDLGPLNKALDMRWFIRTSKDAKGNPVHKVDMPSILMTLDEIASALSHLHLLNIVHRDLKLRNILMKTDKSSARGWRVCLADFGLSMMLKDNIHISCNAAGTLQYMPPELLSKGRVCWQTDVYAFGIIMWEIFHCRKAYSHMNKPEVMSAVLEHGHRPQFVKQTPIAYQELAMRCWQSDWTKRPSCQEIRAALKHMVVRILQSISEANGPASVSGEAAAAVLANSSS